MFGLPSRSTSRKEPVQEASQPQVKRVSTGPPIGDNAHAALESSGASTSDSSPPASTPSTTQDASTEDVPTPAQEPTPRSQKRFSWRSLVSPRGVQDRKASLPPPLEEAHKEETARQEYVQRQILRTRSDKRAHESALVVRELIVGPFANPTAAPPKSAKVSASAVTSLQRVQKVKAQLLEPKAAQKVIAQLRQLPTSDAPVVVGKTRTGETVKTLPRGPIHAVCLPYTDAEAHEKRFSKLDKLVPAAPAPSPSTASPKMKARSLDLSAVSSAAGEIASVTATSLEKLKEVLDGLDLVSLITTPDLGLGHPGNGPGLLSGAIPSADAIVDGVEQITPQLMALGYATGKAILPSHANVYPPTDRMSVITYWWGLEIAMPEPSVQYLSNVPSIAHTVINFMTALSVASGGVREIMPFVRYISQYIDAEWNLIQQADQGQGVVCAATWIMPAALVPRAWDFPQQPASSSTTDSDTGNTDASKSAPNGATPAQPSADTSSAVPNPQLLTPPLPDPNHAPVFVAPPGDPAARLQSVQGDPANGVPGVTVTPPTPPASDTLGKAAAEGAIKSAATASGEGASVAGNTKAPTAIAVSA
ncbi:hypothetical protein C8Q73DRAFT_790318 [Cubamyces lactineus]|nr:hypothetical protein C8Q73DRAFT_790318 [Cubamyces lactineus]